MKIGIFLENFTTTELKKDPGIIAKLLSKFNEVTIIGKNITEEAKNVGTVHTGSLSTLRKKDFWERSNLDAVIMYSWLSIRYTKIIQAITSTETKLILKLDSDGKLLFPLLPSYLDAYKKSKGLKNKIKYIVRSIEWKVIPKIISRIKIKQIENAHAIIIESEKAKENLILGLMYFKKSDLIQKIYSIPNPVEITQRQVIKENIVLCVGRWNDPRKNKEGLIECLAHLEAKWQVVIVGNGSKSIVSKIKAKNSALAITAIEYLKHSELLQLTAKSKIFFSSSTSESFGLAAAEMLCLGGSVVAGPIPSFLYFAQNGTNGTLSRDWGNNSLAEALESDINKWEANYYNPELISNFWRKELNPEKIAQQIISLIKTNE